MIPTRIVVSSLLSSSSLSSSTILGCRSTTTTTTTTTTRRTIRSATKTTIVSSSTRTQNPRIFSSLVGTNYRHQEDGLINTKPTSVRTVSTTTSSTKRTRQGQQQQQQNVLFSSTSDNNNTVATTTTGSSAETTTLVSRDGVVGTPIDFDVASKIEGNESQILIVTLYPGQVLRAESGAMMYMTDGITMNTTTGGGLSTGFQRMLTGQNFFISDYTYSEPTSEPAKRRGYGTVALGTDFPSKIIRLNIADYGGKIVCQKGALLCANHTIDIQMEFSKNFSTGFFGGEGFVLQGLTGEGDVFLKAGGTVIRRELKEGEQLRISSGCLVAFSHGVDYDVQMVKGFTNVFAGGEGLFITTLTGPGVVWLQGQPPQRMISEIARRVPSGGGIGFGIPIGGGGGGSGGSGDSSGGGGGETPSS